MRAVIRPAAKQDILRQFLYWLDQDAPETAARFLEEVDQAVLNLSYQPGIGSPKQLKNPRLEGLRRWPVKGFEFIGIYYLQMKETVQILRVLHGKREVRRILDE